MPALFKCEICGRLIIYGSQEPEPLNVLKHVVSHQNEAYYLKVKAKFNGGEA